MGDSDLSPHNLILYIFLNEDIGLSRGEYSAQTSHVTQVLTDHLVRQGYETFPPTLHFLSYSRWKLNPVTVIYRTTTEDLLKLKDLDGACHFVDTFDRTDRKGTFITSVAFVPGTLKDIDLTTYRLL